MSKTNLTINAGKTFTRVVRWAASPFVYIPITAISQGAPVSITAPTHGMPNAWPAAVVSVKGMTEINALNSPPKPSDFKKGIVTDVNTVQFNEVISADFHAYRSGGFLTYYTPVDLTGYAARMTIKNRVGGVVLKALVSPGDIALDNTLKTITITIAATDTATFAQGDYVYDLELVKGSSVSLLLEGKVTVIPEVTT